MSYMNSFKRTVSASFAILSSLALASPVRALDADSDLVRSIARQVSRSLSPEVARNIVPLPAREVAPPAATLPVAFAISPTAVIERSVMAPEAGTAASRSKAFPILATTYVALNALDIITTTKAVSSGRGVEANPILGPVAPTPAALTAVKIATTATTVIMAQRLWKHHRVASVVLMVAANIGTGFIVSHNASIAMR